MNLTNVSKAKHNSNLGNAMNTPIRHSNKKKVFVILKTFVRTRESFRYTENFCPYKRKFSLC